MRTLINALMASDEWKRSAFMWTYDDWGGWYDHVPPPRVDRFGYGFRVPALLVSPYARRGHVDSTVLDFTSILKFIEENWGLEPLAARDAQGEQLPLRLRLHASAARSAAPVPRARTYGAGQAACGTGLRGVWARDPAHGIAVLGGEPEGPTGSQPARSGFRPPREGRRDMSRRHAAWRGLVVTAVVALVTTAPAWGRSTAGAPTVLEVQTVPPVAGMMFTLDGQRFASRGDGIARITYTGSTPLRARLGSVETVTRPGVRASLGRWYGDLDRPGQKRLVAALNVYYAVEFSFENLRGELVDLSRVESLTLKSSHGVVHQVQGKAVREPQWLQGVRVISTREGPQEKDILQSIERVGVDGTNVVNRSQQRFYPHRQRHFGATLLLYSARFAARDALFGFPIGSGVRLRHPDGKWTYHPFHSSAELTVNGLARGEYWVEVKAPGLSFLRPVTLSRNQHVPLEVLSYLDVALVLGVLAATALGLLYIGRPHLFSVLGVLRPASLHLLAPQGGRPRRGESRMTGTFLAVRSRAGRGLPDAGDFDIGEAVSKRTGELVPRLIRVPCPTCARVNSPMLSPYRRLLHEGWRSVGDDKQRYADWAADWGARCPGCRNEYRFTTHSARVSDIEPARPAEASSPQGRSPTSPTPTPAPKPSRWRPSPTSMR